MFRLGSGKSALLNSTSFLLVMHNLDLSRRCDRIIEVVDGRVQG